MDRRAPYLDIYQLAYQNRLAEQSYTFFCHEDDFSSLYRKYAGSDSLASGKHFLRLNKTSVI